MQTEPTEGLRLAIGDRHSEPVASLEVASRVYQQLRDASGEAPYTWPPGRVTQNGIFVARICYNGHVWGSETHTPREAPLQTAAKVVVPLDAERIGLDVLSFCGPVNRWLERHSFGPLADDMRARLTNPDRYHEGTALLMDLASDPGIPWELLAPIGKTMALGRARELLKSGPLSIDTLGEVARPLGLHRGATFVDFVGYVDRYTTGDLRS